MGYTPIAKPYTVSPDLGSWSNSVTSSAIRSQNSDACLRDAGVPDEVHGKADDEFFAHEGDVDAARELVATVGPQQGKLFVYPGDEHLFVDSSLPTYDADAAALVTQRTLHFLSVL